MSTPTKSSVAGDVEVVRRILAHIDADTTDEGDAWREPVENYLDPARFAAELETLRSQWETTKNYRLSDKFDFEKSPPGTSGAGNGGGDFGGLASWRRGLDIGDGDDEEENQSPTVASDGTDTVRGEGEEEAGMAVTTPTRANMI